MEVPPDTLVMGAPAKPRRPVSAEEKARFQKGVAGYMERGQQSKEESGKDSEV
jgi:carbonic anhydrase/acetyltransferase-like protein (isoleucine patch superfamily)